MGIKSFFGSLFWHSDNQIPSSLGRRATQEPNSIKLGMNIEQLQDEEPVKEGGTEHQAVSEQVSGNDESVIMQSRAASATYNLIILDESGSMSGVRMQTISGCNETLNSIRNTAREQPENKQIVSIFCFDNTDSRYIFQNVPVEEASDLTTADYSPNSCTPLYDAIGYTVTQLHKVIAESDSTALITIITDGYENASRRWNHHSVVELIESLKKKGWVFTFIGANIDVEQTARGLGINSFVEFEQSDLGMSEMFEQERRSRRAFSEKMRYMRSRACYYYLSSG